MTVKKVNRRRFLSASAIVMTGVMAAACKPKIVEVEKVITKEVERIVKETIIIEGTPQVVEKVVKETVVVEKEVTAVPGPEEVKTIKLAVGLSPVTEPLMNNMLSQFQEEQGVDVQVAALPPYVGFFEKILTQIAGGTGPDVALMLAYWTAVLGKAEVLLKLDDYLTTPPAEQYDPVLLGSYC